MIRYLLEDGGFLRNLRGDMLFTAFYISNRSPHSALTEMIYIRLAARVSIYIETQGAKLDDRVYEENLVGFSTDSRTSHIYNPTIKTVESRNVIFLETPAYSVPPSEEEANVVINSAIKTSLSSVERGRANTWFVCNDKLVDLSSSCIRTDECPTTGPLVGIH